MARYSENDTSAIYAIADQWRKSCLTEGKSLLWNGEDIWTEHNLQEFKKHYTDQPDESKRTFEEKFKVQLEPASADVTKLACEIVLVYFLFPSTATVCGNRKEKMVEMDFKEGTMLQLNNLEDLLAKLSLEKE